MQEEASGSFWQLLGLFAKDPSRPLLPGLLFKTPFWAGECEGLRREEPAAEAGEEGVFSRLTAGCEVRIAESVRGRL